MTTDALAGQRVVVTGATGLIGSWLVRDLLAAGADVLAVVLDHDPRSLFYSEGLARRCAIVDGTLTDAATIERALGLHGPQTVFHLGAQTIVGAAHDSPVATFEANIRGTYHVLEAARRLDVGVVVASSDKAYGHRGDLPYREDMPLSGIHPYEVSKSCADLLTTAYHRTYGLAATIARCGNVFGGGDLNWSRIVPGTIRSLLGGQRPIIRGDGRHTRDYLYVEDVADAYLRLARGLTTGVTKGEAFNFSYGQPISVLDLVQRIRRTMGLEHLEPEILDVARGEIRDQYLSCDKARRVLGWRPRFDIETGLKRTIAWYRRHLAGPTETPPILVQEHP